jgi:ABC-type sugar transport system substrate-binding protein
MRRSVGDLELRGRGCPGGQDRPVTRRAAAAALVGVLGALAGCDSGSFAPPPPPELASLSDPRATPAAVAVELILAPGEDPDRDLWVQAARIEAGKTKAILTVSRPDPGATSSWQADRIRSAPGRGGAVLLVESVDNPDVAAALNEARDEGVKVVLVGHDVAARDPSKPFQRVTFGTLDVPARKLVEAVRKEARSTGLPENGHALIALPEKAGSLSRAFAAQFESKLKALGTESVTVVPIKDESHLEANGKAIKARVEADPAVTMVLTVEHPGLSAALGAHEQLKAKREFSIAGAVSFEALSSRLDLLVRCAGLIDRRLSTLGREAIRTAVRVARGEKVEPVVIIPVEFEARRTTDPDAAPTPPGVKLKDV